MIKKVKKSKKKQILKKITKHTKTKKPNLKSLGALDKNTHDGYKDFSIIMGKSKIMSQDVVAE